MFLSRFRRSPLFYRYLGSYVAVLIVPMLLLGYFGYSQLVQIVNHEVELGNEEMLSQIRDSVDIKITEMNKIAGQIAITPELTPFSINENFFNAYQAKRLMDFKIANDFLYEVLLYIRDEDYLYSTKSTYRTSMFINEIYRYKKWPQESFLADLNTAAKPVLRPAEEVDVVNQSSGRFITYLVPIPRGSQHPYGTVMFLVEEKSLLNYINYESKMRSGNTIVFDENRNIVTAARRTGYLGMPGLFETVTAAKTDFAIAEVEQTPYYISHVRSDQTHWTYVTMLPVADVMKPIRVVAGRWLNALLLIFAVGAAITYAVMVYNYNPVRKLVQLADSYRDRFGKKGGGFDMIGSVLSSMAESNQALEMKVAESRSAVREHLLTGLLKGEFDSVEAFNQRGREVGLAFSHPRLFIAILETRQSADTDMRHSLEEAVRLMGGGHTEVHSKISLEERRIVWICSSSLTDAELESWLSRVHARFAEELGAAAALGAGRPYEDASQVGRSFLEASAALDYKLIKGNNRLILFHEVMSDDTAGRPQARQELEQLKLLLRQGDTDQIAATIGRLSDNIAGSSTLFAARCLCYDIINTVVHTMDELSADYPELHPAFPDVLTLMAFDTAGELVEMITKACADLCRAVQQHRGQPGAKPIEAMIAYVRSHYSDYDFSIQRMADAFSLSQPYVSRMFKEQTGRTISDYVNHIRIEEAKRLLQDREASVKDIVQQIGYSDVSSFIRKFKTTVGMTPGEYRKLLKSDKG
jgi:two-component system response regulator YesN